MKKILITIALAALAGSASAATIKPSQAAASQGQLVIVEGTANVHADSSQSGTDVDVMGPDNSHLTGFIPMGSQNVFPEIDSVNGKLVDVTGVVLFDGGRTIIRLTRSNQVKLASP